MRQRILLLALTALVAALCFPLAMPTRREAADYAKARVHLVKKEAYEKLLTGSMYYTSQATDPANMLARKPMTFKWGETLYLLVDNFPYRAAGTTHPPMAVVSLMADGKAVRTLFTEVRPYMAATPTTLRFEGPEPNSGFALVPLPLSSKGTGKPPQNVEVALSFVSTEESGKPVTYKTPQRLKIPLKRASG